jgi:Helix-turn-helix domain
MGRELRLQEVRRLMLTKSLDVAEAAFQVGYDDASHFSREYKSTNTILADLLNCRRKIFNPSLAAPASPRAFGVPTGSVPNRGVWLQSGRESRPWGSVPNRDIP